jgi:hypothetical protein
VGQQAAIGGLQVQVETISTRFRVIRVRRHECQCAVMLLLDRQIEHGSDNDGTKVVRRRYLKKSWTSRLISGRIEHSPKLILPITRWCVTKRRGWMRQVYLKE